MAARESIETVDLIVFVTVARTGSFAAAAKELRLATPSVSTRMAALERKLAAELFVRSARGSLLTAAGQRFQSYARRCLSVLDEAHHAVPADGRERLVVAGPASLGAVVFAPVLRLLGDVGVTAHCRVSHSEEVISFLLDGSADVGFALNAVVPASMASRRMSRSRLLTVSAPDHRLANRAQVTVDDLIDTSVTVYRWNREAQALASTFDHPRRPPNRPVQVVGLPTAAVDLAVHSGYVAVIPEFAAAAALRSGVVTALPLRLPSWSLDVQVVYRRESARRTGVQTLIRNLATIAEGIRVNR